MGRSPGLTVHITTTLFLRSEALARGDERKGDLLEVLLDAQAENRANNLPPLSDAELWENVHDVMGAGHETTASTLTAALYSVAAHPQVDARVAAELAQVLGVGEEVSRGRRMKNLPRTTSSCLQGKHTVMIYRDSGHMPNRPAGLRHPRGAASCSNAALHLT